MSFLGRVFVDWLLSSIQNKFQSEESTIYVHHVTILQKSYNELTMTSKKRLSDLEMLQDFIQSATTELIWLNEKEEIEISRDWSSKSLNVAEIERYYEVSIFLSRAIFSLLSFFSLSASLCSRRNGQQL